MPGELRNNEQNRRYWKVTVGRVRDYLQREAGHGISKHAVHDGFKAGYLGMVENPLGGPPIPRSTTTCSVPEFADYMTRIEADFSMPPRCIDFTEHVE
jgi:hypothetical protein